MPGAQVFCAALLCVALAACGGGGKSKNAGAAKPAPSVSKPKANTLSLPDVPADWQTDAAAWAAHDEYRRQPGLGQINAAGAYAKGITGAGVTIGFVDTGLDDTHEEFGGKRIEFNDRMGLSEVSDRQLRHGTGVVSIATGARDTGSGMHGVAFHATPAMWSLRLDSAGYLTVNDGILTRGTRALQNNGARIINQSWGYATLLEASLSDTQRRFLQHNYADFIDEMRRGAAIHVWAAGNSGGDEISVSTAWPLLFPDLAGLSIAVAAIGEDGTIGARSNRCGVAKDHCLVAPGGAATGGYAFTRMARAGGGYRTALGTSYAAPYVSGVLALMQQAFGDQLSLPEYTARLLATANKQGIYANEEVYGQGLVDAEAALTPQGDTHIPLPSGGLIAPRDGRITGGLLPEEMLERLRRERIIILDELNTPFTAQLAVKPDPYQSFQLTEWMTHGDNKTAPYSHPTLASFAQLFDGASLGDYWQLVPVSLRDNSLNGDHLPQFGFGFTARRTRRRSRLELGLVSEQDRLLGSEGSGALKLGNTHSALLGYSRHVTLGDADIGFAAHFTFSQAECDDKSLMRGTKGALASAFGVTMKRGDWHWALKQPTYFELGELRLNVPVRRLADGGVVFENRTFDMRGAHRPLEVSMMHGDAMAKIGLRIETPNGRDVRAGFGYFKRF
jgi:hypothetical protein